ncbi:hypothetical protein HUJ05_002695 [Dendroctonus ponderosae]|nr:hypothetical protein HUJ05_002695 [Dendroctonus ponderosae]
MISQKATKNGTFIFNICFSDEADFPCLGGECTIRLILKFSSRFSSVSELIAYQADQVSHPSKYSNFLSEITPAD